MWTCNTVIPPIQSPLADSTKSNYLELQQASKGPQIVSHYSNNSNIAHYILSVAISMIAFDRLSDALFIDSSWDVCNRVVCAKILISSFLKFCEWNFWEIVLDSDFIMYIVIFGPDLFQSKLIWLQRFCLYVSKYCTMNSHNWPWPALNPR